MNIDHNKNLDRFENRHGEYYDLLNKYADAKYGPCIDYQKRGFQSREDMVCHYDALLKTHHNLVMLSSGYREGIKQMNRYKWQLFCVQWTLIGYEVCK